MKKIFTLIILLSAFSFAYAQAPAIQWENCYGGSQDDAPNSIIQLKDGGCAIVGSTRSSDGDVTGHHGTVASFDLWLVVTKPSGKIKMQKCLGGNGTDVGNSIQETDDSDIIVAGYTNSNNGDVTTHFGAEDYWVVKLSSKGKTLWQKSYGGHGRDIANCIKKTKDGGFVLAGYTESVDGNIKFNHGGYDFWVVKIDSVGNLQWQRTYGGTFDDIAYSIDQTKDGGYIVAGETSSSDGDVSGNHGYEDYWLVRLDEKGDIIWERSYGGSSDDIAHSVAQTSDNGFIVAGSSRSLDGDVTGVHGDVNQTDFWLVKTDENGNIAWEKAYGGTQDEDALSVQQTSDGGYVAVGQTGSFDSGDVTGDHKSADYWIIKTDALGNLLWNKCLGGHGTEYGFSACQTLDGGYAVAGMTEESHGEVTGCHGGYDYWVVKLAPDHSTQSPKIISAQISLDSFSVFPNPSKGCFNINLKSADSRLAEIDIYNSIGEIILRKEITIENGLLQAKIDLGTDTPKGMYSIMVRAGDKEFKSKILID